MNSLKSYNKTFQSICWMNRICYIFNNVFFRILDNTIIKLIYNSCITNNQVIFRKYRYIAISYNCISNKLIPFRNSHISICYNFSVIYITSKFFIIKVIINYFIKLFRSANCISFSIICIKFFSKSLNMS